MEWVSEDQISVLAPVNQAVEKTKMILFRPFNFKKWFIIGFCSWLTGLTSGGGGLNFSRNFPRSTENFKQSIDQIPAWVMGSIIGVVIILAVLVVVFLLVSLWISSRGQFMLIDCIVYNRGEIASPWKTYRKEGNNLFIFNLITRILFFLILIIAAGASVAVAVPSIMARTFGASAIAAIIVGFLLLFTLIIIAGVFFLFLNDFVVPLMYLKGTTAKETYKEFWKLCKMYPGKFVLYYLFKILLGIALGTAVAMAGMIFLLVTCGLACCIAVIPIIGILIFSFLITEIVLPFRVFIKSYSLYFLSQFGDTYNIWSKAEEIHPAF